MWGRSRGRGAPGVGWQGAAGAAGSVLLAAGMAGCSSGGEEGAPWPTYAAVSVSPSVSASPSGTPRPSLPVKAEHGGTDGGKAFIGYWFEDVFVYVTRTYDTTPMDEISDKECQYCNSTKKLVREAREKGGSQTGGRLRVQKIYVVPGDHEHELIATIELHQDDIVSRDTPTSKLETIKAGTWSGTVRLVRRDGRWVFYAYRFLSGGKNR